MTLTKVTEDATGHAKNAIGVNTAVYDMNGIRLDAKTFDETTGTLNNILEYVFAGVPWNIRFQSANNDMFAFEIKQDDTAQAVLQSVVTLFGVEVDAFMEPVTGATTGALIFGNANAIKRVIVVADELGSDKQIPVVYGHNMTSLSKTTVSDVFGTRFKVIGADDLTIESVNNGSPYLVDDVANQRHNPIGWANGTYRDLIITNNAIKDAKALLTWGKDQVEQLNHPRANYEVSAVFSDGIALGDSIIVQDLYAGTPIVVKSRAIKIQSSQANPYSLTVTIGEFVDISRRTNVMTSVLAIANSAKTIAIEAQSAADTAQVTADTASSSAQVAQSMANTVSSSVANAVDSTVAKAQSMDAALNQSINDSINETMTTVNTSLAVLDSEAAVFKSEADSATSSVASSVSTLMTTTTASLAAYASSATSSANKALSSAAGAASSAATALSQAGVNSLATSSVASDVNGLKASYTSLNSSAGVLTSQTASLAVSASSASAQFDKVTSTTGSLATETAALKISASSASAEFTKVNSSAGSLATQAASLAVSASSAAIGISNVTSSAGSLATRTASLAVSASSFSTSITSMSSQNGSQATAISALTQRADGFDLTVSKVDNLSTGDRNYILETGNPKIQTSNGLDNQDLFNSAKFYSPIKNWGVASGDYVIAFDWKLKTALGSDMSASFFFNQSPWQQQYFTIKAGKLSGHVESKIKLLPGILTATNDVTGINFRIMSQMASGNTITYSNLFMKDGTIPTTWSPAPEDIDAQFATQKITIDGITSTVSKQTTDINAVTTRVQTAEGSISTATNNITGLQSSQTQTANQLQTEITDRNTGDSNTLTQAKSFTTSQITSYDTGIQSQFTQTSNAILASIESTNLVVNSEFDPLNGTWYAFNQTAGSTLGSAWSAAASSSFGDWPVVNGSRVIAYSAIQWYSTALKPTSAAKAFSASIVVGRASATATTAFDFRIAFWDSSKKLISNLGSTNPVNGSSYVGAAKYVTENITSPTGTAYVSLVIAHSSGNAQDFITRPMLNYGVKVAAYSPTYGTTSSSTVLSLMTDNYSFGINSNGQLVSGISGNEELLTLTGKTIHLTGETTVDGDFYALGGNFKNLNASEIKTGTINASLINVINLNANNITTGTLNSNNVAIVGTNTSIDLSDGGLTISETSKPSAILHTYLETGQLRFEMRESTNIKTVGGLTTMANTSDTTANGIGLFLEQYNKSSYSNAGGDELYLSKSRSDGNYDFGYVWSAGGKVRNTGHHFYDRVYFEGNDLNFSGSKVYINGAYQPLLFTWISWSDLGDTKYPALGDDDQQVGIAFGSGTLYIYSPSGRKSWGQL
ncbi:phage tail spike protein [Weissella soli]|uniref:phage tail spike protein n=1 Tax=Weissella soli TaxID=155866 RepID=UPI0011BB8E6C|nr:phage tail spike protein [Weissella soli]QEA34774.1 hypothetical protein FGL88_02975 [Weissella soli]